MAYQFTTASSQYLRVPSAVVTTTPLTMACWFNPNNTTSNLALVCINGEIGAADRYGLFALGGVAGDPLRADTNGNFSAQTTVGFQASTWQHAAGVWPDTNSRTVYLNGGNSVTHTGLATPASLAATAIGARFSGSYGLFMAGLIAEVGIWNAALTAAEIASLAKGMTCDKVRPQSLVFYAPLVRDLIDAKGGLTITNNNTATVANHPRVYA
jgi:hypothetical protein